MLSVHLQVLLPQLSVLKLRCLWIARANSAGQQNGMRGAEHLATESSSQEWRLKKRRARDVSWPGIVGSMAKAAVDTHGFSLVLPASSAGVLLGQCVADVGSKGQRRWPLVFKSNRV